MHESPPHRADRLPPQQHRYHYGTVLRPKTFPEAQKDGKFECAKYGDCVVDAETLVTLSGKSICSPHSRFNISSNISPDLPGGLFPPDVPTEIVFAYLVSHICVNDLLLLGLLTIILGEKYRL